MINIHDFSPLLVRFSTSSPGASMFAVMVIVFCQKSSRRSKVMDENMSHIWNIQNICKGLRRS